MYCIDVPRVPETNVLCFFHILYVEPQELPPLNINAMAPVSMQYILKGITSRCLQKLYASMGIGIVHLGPPDIPLKTLSFHYP